MMKVVSLKTCLLRNNIDYYYYDSVNSTMDEINNNISSKKIDTLVRAGTQKNGRGRLGAKWISPRGNIYCSFALKTTTTLNNQYIYNKLTSLSIKDSLEYIGMQDVKFKWPNDIFFEKKKISGIIIENINLENNNNFIVLGIGINFTSSPSLKKNKTTNILRYIKDINIDNFFKIFVNYFFYNLKSYNSMKISNINERFINSLMYIKKKIRIKVDNKKILTGIFHGLNDDGSLILKQKNKFISIYVGKILT